MVEAGETVTDAPVNAPGFQVYVVAPDADKVDEPPEQIPAGLAEAIIVGVGLTVIATVLVPVQIPLAPVTVYVVEVAGETATVTPDKEPGIHV